MSVLRHSSTRTRWLLALAASFLLASASTSAGAEDADEVDALIERIVSLRVDVEALDGELTRLESEHERRMSSLSRRHADLELERARAQRELDRRRKRLAEVRDEIGETGDASDDLAPVLEEAIEGAREHVRGGLPFKQKERLASLDELETQLETGALDPARVANRLWAFHEDELRLARETGLFRQAIEIGGDERLVDVVRIGMMMLFFRGDGGLYGHAVKQGDGWAFRQTRDRDTHERIDALIDAMRKQIRTGLFQIPNALDLPESD